MLARTRAFTIEGVQARVVTVEVDIRGGLPGFAIVGLADAAVREARDRVHSAVLNSGFQFPTQRITANLAPADLPKAGPGLDLALACAVLAASEQLSPELLDGCAMFGELALDGQVRAVHGTLAVAEAARRAGARRLLVASACAREAMLVEGLDVAAVDRLSSAVRVLGGGEPDPLGPVRFSADSHDAGPHLDMCDVRGQAEAVRALTVAAAGAHNSLLWGPPGTGKTMLAQRVPSILPPLTRTEAIEVTRIHSVVGGESAGELARARPFRAPHHSVTTAGLIGGAKRGWVGEAVLAHNGVLFLDELSEFARAALEALRQPLEEGRVAIARAQHSAVYPAKFMLLAATNPCPCGYAGEGSRCVCRRVDLARYRRRLSGPLLDRIDLLVPMRRPSPQELAKLPLASSESVRAQVSAARERQAWRLREEGVLVNAHMDAAMLRRHACLDEPASRMLGDAAGAGELSTRGLHRAVRVARTIADLAGSDRVQADHLATALELRADAMLAPARPS